MTTTAQETIELQASFVDIFKALGLFFVGLFKGIFTTSQAKALGESIVDFAQTEIGQLAVDAWGAVEASMPGSSGTEKRDAAVAKLKADAAAAGKDLAGLATSTLNTFIEMAGQYLLAKGLNVIVKA